jgi:hypothetical protein
MDANEHEPGSGLFHSCSFVFIGGLSSTGSVLRVGNGNQLLRGSEKQGAV